MTRRIRSSLALALGVGCAANPATPDAPSARPPLAIAWSGCALATPSGRAAECASVEVPYRWDVDDGRTLQVFVKRLQAPGSEPRGQVWLLQGGPGASGQGLDALAEHLWRMGIPLDVYVLDQRGTGRSSRLGCAEQESATSRESYRIADDEWPACLAAMQAAWEPSLAGFSVTNTARDLGALVDTLRHSPDERVLLYGVSYAPYLLNRYLQLYPAQPSGVVMDSICPVGECSFARADARFNDVARTYFAACGAHATCAARLGPDPWATLGALLARLDGGHCPAAAAAGLTRAKLRGAFAQLLYHWDTRALVPAFVHRLDRCGPADAPVIERFGRLLAAPPTAASVDAFSLALATHISLSELWDVPEPSLAELRAGVDAQCISNGAGPSLASRGVGWPRVPHDAYYGSWAMTAVPMLMLAGSLDPATPVAFVGGARQAFAGPHQTFVEVPRATHCVLAESPTLDGPDCGMTLVEAFLRDPQATIDTTCVSRVAPLSFSASPASASYFGTADLWGD